MSYEPAPKRSKNKIGNGFVGDPDSVKKRVILHIPFKFLKRIDHYCDTMMIPRTEFLKAAYLHYMKEKGIYDYAPIEHESSVDTIPTKIVRERELDIASWITDGRDFGESDDHSNELADDADPGEEIRI